MNGKTPQLGKKLDFILGKATGNNHNIQRSKDMLRQMERIGLPDNPSTRKFLEEHFTEVINNPHNIRELQSNGRAVRESLLMGPNGGLKTESIWDGDKLITVKLLGGK
jgi:hypothetical protein